MRTISILLILLVTSFSLWAQQVPDTESRNENKFNIFPYIDNSKRDVALAWDSHTGQSVFYNWNSTDHNWKPYSINLPSNPVEGSKGKIMMIPYIDNSGRDVALTWDMETGKSVFYAWNKTDHNWKAYSINLPAEPIPGAKGQIKMVPYIDKSGRDVCLTWDIKTGKSTFYSWNKTNHNWKAYAINLPEKPVPGSQGKIMMEPYIDKSGRDVCLTWDVKTGKSVFYAWNKTDHNWKAYAINLPENPVPGAKGKIMMFPYIDNSGRDVVLTWDAKSGKSVFYAWNKTDHNWKAYAINLPEKPISGATGKMMMVPYIDKSGRDVCLVWDSKTGKSVYYSWSKTDHNWKPYSINLPEKLLP